jgi:tryptophan synthase alpha chain
VDSVLVADVPMFEAAPYLAASREAKVAPVLIAAPNTSDATLRKIAAGGEGYTYCVARAGVTGADEEVRFGHSQMLGTLKAFGAPPPVFGFGISQPAHVAQALEAGAAGVISGSAIVRLIAANPGAEADAVRPFVAEMKAATLPRRSA